MFTRSAGDVLVCGGSWYSDERKAYYVDLYWQLKSQGCVPQVQRFKNLANSTTVQIKWSSINHAWDRGALHSILTRESKCLAIFIGL